jgi:hypothetical protein
MSRKTIVTVSLATSLAVVGVLMLVGEKSGKKAKIEEKVEVAAPFDKAIATIEKVADENAKISASALHSDILRVIAAGTETVCGITPAAAEDELNKKLASSKAEQPMTLGKLPFDIVKIIAKSPASLANIKPRSAVKEIIKRYLSLNIDDPDGVNSVILLEALQRQAEQEAIDKWADNEDAEAIEKFMREEADRDPSSVANFVYGLKHLASEKDKAMEYMDRFAKNVNQDLFDSESGAEDYKTLVEAVKKLRK